MNQAIAQFSTIMLLPALVHTFYLADEEQIIVVHVELVVHVSVPCSGREVSGVQCRLT